ncbi:MarR family transcriptional regulator [Pseudooceanicola sp. CBS1P-1]|uniref:MarR family transcriptional regulator n=1 Tax=Pseudooceanicola albus TaxID=2692189 RepID=A0A6L7FY09_9RHOB|nr:MULTISPECIES: MarR family transcriptional regulator [Pseudooceanicola]MBT9382423.1 MarR family transcriptional regulator [Pseudooceanicola endophyticus]MXN16964.1 MarR family transcriptional regulator [Pseudooceanicola albus]
MTNETPCPADAVTRMEPEIAFMVRGLEGIYRRRKYPMERAHYLVLMNLLEGPLASGALAARLSLDQSTITRQIAAMEKRGLVEKRANPKDGRGVVIAATPEGEARYTEMRALRLERLSEMLSDWPEADRARFAELITRFNSALMASEGGQVLKGR